MSKTIVWAISHLVTLAVVWAGYIEGVQGARYVFGFYVLAICLPVMYIAALADGVVELQPNRIKCAINATINGAALFVLVWHGSFIVAAAWLMSMVCATVAQKKARRSKCKSNGPTLQQQMAENMDFTERSLRDASDMPQRTSGKAHRFRFKDQA